MNDQKQESLNNQPILNIESISKSFGGLQALCKISFRVAPGIIQAVIGPNGAGKTTLFNVITGSYAPDTGRIIFNNLPIQGKKNHDIVRTGISRTFQNVELFENMTVIENVMVGCHVRTRAGFWGAMFRMPWTLKEEKLIREDAMNLLSFVGLDSLAEQRSGDLPFGWQRLVEIARALASKPKVLLLDEPAAGLNAIETRQLGELLRKIKNDAVTLLLVEHDMSLTMEISDRIVVLKQGMMLAEGTPREIQANEAVMAAYLGVK